MTPEEVEGRVHGTRQACASAVSLLLQLPLTEAMQLLHYQLEEHRALLDAETPGGSGALILTAVRDALVAAAGDEGIALT